MISIEVTTWSRHRGDQIQDIWGSIARETAPVGFKARKVE